MKRKALGITGIIIGVLVLLAVAVYLGLGFYYSNSFYYGTWINDHLCVGMTEEEVNALLSKETKEQYKELCLVDKDGNEYVIPVDAIDFNVDYKADIRKLKESQSPYRWGIDSLRQEKNYVDIHVTFDEGKLYNYVNRLTCVKHSVYNPNKKVEIRKTENGYVLDDDLKDMVHPELVFEAAKEAVYNLEARVDLKEKGCYEDVSPSSEDWATRTLWRKIEKFQSFKLIYQIYDHTEEIVDQAIVFKWMLRDENGDLVYDEAGNIALDEEKVMEFAQNLSDKYDTTNRPHAFKTTRGDTVTIEKGTYGNDIDEEKEAEQIIEEFYSFKTEIHREPIYKVRAWGQGDDDIGNTYIEVDMENQHLYYYVDGEIALETDVVTGNTSRRMGTPARVCYVYGKQRNRTLRGPGYATFVYYWMPVNGNIGLHDATWRKAFGGEIYKTNGSHGCVNMPKDKAKELYEMVEIGTPCIMFY